MIQYVLILIILSCDVANGQNSKIVENHIISIAKRERFYDIDLLLAVAMAESTFRPWAIRENIRDNGRVWSTDRGLYGWNDYFHPYISDKCAYSIECSTVETIKAIKNGNIYWWKASYSKIISYIKRKKRHEMLFVNMYLDNIEERIE